MKRAVRTLVRFLIVWVVEALALLLTVAALPGIDFDGTKSYPFVTALLVSFVLAVLNAIVRPILVMVLWPINAATIGLSTLVINAVVLLITARLVPGFAVDSFLYALLATLILTVVNTILMSIVRIEDEGSYYSGVAKWIISHATVDTSRWPGRGVVMLEIDGLSNTVLQRALDAGRLPYIRSLLASGSHSLSPYDCGLPSQTSACQAGIMYGENWDIPAFRWYDKASGRVISSSSLDDAAAMNARLSTGNGLLRGGTGIDNHMMGDAETAVAVMSGIKGRSEEMRKRSGKLLNLFFINPYMFERTLMAAISDLFVEFWQALRQKVKNVQPRVSRMHGGYPVARIGTNVFLRNVSSFMVLAEMLRGSPAIYTTYVGYDEVAHHAGPLTKDALDTLDAIDEHFSKIIRLGSTKAPRQYDFFILSDHGQSWGATFKQRYDKTIDQLLEGLLSDEASVTAVDATEHAGGQTSAMMTEVQQMSGKESSGLRKKMTRGLGKLAHRSLRKQEPEAAAPARVVACSSGNLANVYFNLPAGTAMADGKIALSRLDAAHPGMTDGLVRHEGVGLVIGYADDGAPVVLGKDGRRDLVTGKVHDSDPLTAYGDPALRARQLRRVADFPHAGDLILVSTLYDDGTVAAFEELVGNHGGLGGLQTEPFIIHPADMIVPPTENSCDIFPLLDGRRGMPIPAAADAG
jgi:uncharacterized membrane protein YvlD (DUF360 family)